MNSPLEYRSDIDGLRAIAVGGVLLYHLGVPWLPGGFTGVDVFFVISGYLITCILTKDIEQNNFSIIQFYERRIKRIFPALLVMLCVILLVGWFFLFPDEYKKLGASALYSVFGLANLYFYWNTNYFDQASELQPLLHNWSLGVEEQFYVFWPIILFGFLKIFKSKKYFLFALCTTVLLLFLFASVKTFSNPKEAFYMPHTRAWELCVGALLVFIPRLSNGLLSNAASILGALLIAWSMTMISANNVFPGVNALYACLGAALIIWPKQKNAISLFLSIKPIVGIGLISYSLYLWHWPLIVLFRHYNNGLMPSMFEAMNLALISIIVASLSWYFVERPFRSKKSIRVKFSVIGALFLTVLSSGYFIHATDGVPFRLKGDVNKIFASNGYGPSFNPDRVCHIGDERILASEYSMDCLKGDILIIGDSHSQHLLPGLKQIFPSLTIAQLTTSGCRPFYVKDGTLECEKLYREFYDYRNDVRYDAVIVAARWNSGLVDNLEDSISRLSKLSDKVYVLGQTMEYSDRLPNLLARSLLVRRGKLDTSVPREIVATDDIVHQHVNKTGAIFLSPLDAICPNKQGCETVTAEGIPIQFDYGHYSPEGAVYVLDKLIEQGLSLTNITSN